MPKIFVSYSSRDSFVVEPIVSELINTFGPDSVLFDKKDVFGGKDFIDFMNNSLAKFTHFVFFISANSLSSYFVSLEWKNALIKCRDHLKTFIPVIVDSTSIPDILLSTHYINLYADGFLSAVNELICSIRGGNTYDHADNNRDNLIAIIENSGDKKITLTIKTRFFTEPNASFCFALYFNQNIKTDFSEPFYGSSERRELNGTDCYLQFVRLCRPLTIESPFTISFISNKQIKFFSAMIVTDKDGRLLGKPILIERRT